MEHGLRLVVKIEAQPVLIGAWLAIEEGEKKKKKPWLARDLGNGGGGGSGTI